jgi:hypothetical protein
MSKRSQHDQLSALWLLFEEFVLPEGPAKSEEAAPVVGEKENTDEPSGESGS